ncbi:MAG TPA: spore coat protein [Natronincola sp.]|nr:spore coat protein [Natronincola sp.]
MHNQGGQYGSYQQRYSGSQSQTIKNPSTQVSKGTEMSDRDRLNDILSTEKYLTSSFNTFVLETSNKNLFNDVLHILNETHHAARDVFNLMFEKGWYTLKQEQPQQIAKEYQKFSGYESQFVGHNHNQHQNQFSTGQDYYPRDY